MSTLDEIIRARQTRQAQRDAAVACVMALAADDQIEVLAELASRIAPQPATTATSVPTTPAKEPEPDPRSPSYTDQAETYVLAHPDGVTTRQVADAVGQPTVSADGTLRSVIRSRKTIERRDGKWYPAAVPPVSKRKTHRAAIAEVMTAIGRPMGAGEIVAGVQQMDPERRREPIEAELHRMRTDGAIVTQGTNGRGATYVLAGGAPAAK